VEGSHEHGNEPSVSLKLLGISSMAVQLAASQEGLGSVSKYILVLYYTLMEAVKRSKTKQS
jgi:hypothetical protein